MPQFTKKSFVLILQNWLYKFQSPSFFILLLLLVGLCSCKTKPQEWIRLSGEAQGTTFNIIYKDSLERDLNLDVDSILKEVDRQLSTYIHTSIISIFNNSDTGYFEYNETQPLFTEMCMLSNQIEIQTNGAFNARLTPLFKLWNKKFKIEPDSLSLSMAKELSLNGLTIQLLPSQKNSISILKKKKQASLNFNAIAQGYTCDVLAQYFNAFNIDHYMIEVGGELIVKGKNERNKKWSIGIDNPEEKIEDRSLSTVLELNQGAIATSGSYRKYYQKNGKKYPHIIDPSTGYPVNHSTLSTTVYHPNSCAKADAYATAFMVMGKDSTLAFIQAHPALNLGVYLIFEENDSLKTYASEKISILIP